MLNIKFLKIDQKPDLVFWTLEVLKKYCQKKNKNKKYRKENPNKDMEYPL